MGANRFPATRNKQLGEMKKLTEKQKPIRVPTLAWRVCRFAYLNIQKRKLGRMAKGFLCIHLKAGETTVPLLTPIRLLVPASVRLLTLNAFSSSDR